MIFLVVLVLFCVALPFFLSRRLSPVPYFPSNSKDIPLIIKSLKLKNNQIVYDLGAGDGVVIFAAARHALEHELSTQFFAVEINPFLIALMYMRRLVHPNRRRIHIVKDDIFTMQFSTPHPPTITFFTYISPWFMEDIYKNISRHISSFHFVSYFYALPKSTKIKPKKVTRGVHKIYEY